MDTLFCFGPGYSAQAYFAEFGGRFSRIAATTRATHVRNPPGAPSIVRTIPFTALSPSRDILDAIAAADCLLVSIPPGPDNDPVLAACADAIAASPRLRSIVYLSTVGVYGDHAGAWVDETSALRAQNARSRTRADAEARWRDLSAAAGKPLAILRLAGIYGPGRNAIAGIRAGTARRIVKPGQIFNRIHVADVARAIDGAFARRADGVFNVCDDEPCPPQDVIAYAAALLRVPPPPEISFDDAKAAMSDMGRSFYDECKRVRNDKIKRDLEFALRYPSYREGLRSLLRDG
ncbi:MAG: NAD(P)-dependent oxidoreductase [Pseudorhodoplanes sp.]|nr:NAD(P)-dependent oxidoreductase [Pseudorhodoplanes sp.]